MLHIAAAVERWMRRLEGVSPAPGAAAESYPTRASVRARWEQTKAELDAYLASLDQAKLDEIVVGRLAGRGADYASRRSDLLLHLANHGTDHRAQVLAILHSEFQVPGVEQDMLLYLIEAGGSMQ
jgi:uncharacterized damage-inducible protein DinB